MTTTTQTVVMGARAPVTAFDLEKKVEEYVRQLAEETDAVRQSAGFKEYLDTMAKFWRYSLHNQILIHIQRQNATRVAGFRTWNEMGRYIKAGQKAIKILAPFTKKTVKKDEQTGKEEETEYTYFCPVSVFDVSQTEGRELPRLDIDIEGNSHQALLDKLVEFCKTRQIEVEFKPLGINGLYGYSQGGKIVIGTNQSVNMQVNTLVHEIAHELIHYSTEGKQFSKEEREIQAESVAYVVCRVLELETKSSQYIAAYAQSKDKVLDSLKMVSDSVRVILALVLPIVDNPLLKPQFRQFQRHSALTTLLNKIDQQRLVFGLDMTKKSEKQGKIVNYPKNVALRLDKTISDKKSTALSKSAELFMLQKLQQNNNKENSKTKKNEIGSKTKLNVAELDHFALSTFDAIMPSNHYYSSKEKGIKIYQNDCIKFLDSLPAESVDIIVTDPAYSGMNQKMKFGNGRIVGNYGKESNDKWFAEFHDTEENYKIFLNGCKRVLKSHGVIYLMFDSFSLLTLGGLLREFFNVKNIIAWDKVNLGMGHNFRRRHEFIVYMSKNNSKLNGRNFPDVWRVKRVHSGEYPTQKPTEVFEIMLAASAKEGNIVCDPFAGSSSAAIAAINKKCFFIGSDTSKKAMEISAKRIEAYIKTGTDNLQKKSLLPENEPKYF